MLTILNNNEPIYNITFHSDFKQLGEIVSELSMKDSKICIVTDSNVGPLYLEQVKNELKAYCKQVDSFTFPAGEENKNLETVQNVYEHLIKLRYDRSDVLLALGGGVVGDLTGYTAASYLRGIRFIQVPTSLLSMVDSSIGGKTGVDFKSYKNMVGAFYQPKAVYMNISVLSSLNEVQFYSGFGEIIKHGLILDKAYFDKLNQYSFTELQSDTDFMQAVIERSCEIKKSIVDIDPMEKGPRAMLNFGHTIGHAVEKKVYTKYLHGECVGIGMAAAAYISNKRELISDEECQTILDCIKKYHLPVKVEGFSLDANEIFDITRNDKKMKGDKIKFILLKNPGEAYIDDTVTKEEMMEAIQSII